MDTEHSERQQGKERERTVVDTEHSERQHGDEREDGGGRSEGCSLHMVALLDSIWIDKLHRLSLPTGKWAQLPFFGPASHWNPQSGWHYSYSKRETLRATQAPKIVNSPPPP